MDKISVYKKIRDIAIQLNNEHSTYCRADLAYELTKFGVERDSLEVSKLAWEAYNYYHNDSTIRNAFLDNEGNQYIVAEYQLYNSINQGDSAAVFPMLNQKMDKLDQSFQSLNSEISTTIKGELIVAGSDMMSRITGTKGASNIQKEATSALNCYATLIDSYSSLKSDVQSIITDFVFLRGEIDKVYRQYVLTLMDTFGDSIKSVAPEMFNFDTIEWLDVASMFHNIQLEYKSVYDNSEALIGSISQSYSEALKGSVNSYKSSGSKSIGLVMAGINMFNHYANAKQETLKLQNQLLSLKSKMKRDATHIKGDESRLFVIYKQINDLFIPKANAFYKYNDQVLSDEYEQILNALYQDPEIKKLKQQRDNILTDYKLYEQNRVDNSLNIDYYTNHLAESKDALSKRTQQYEDAKNSKPSKPFFLFNWFTLGSLKRTYNRDIFEWNEACSPVIREYESLAVDIKVDEDELNQQQIEYKENLAHCNELKKELKELNDSIFNKIKVSKELKIELSYHLESIIRLLWVAKDIISSKLDDKLVRVVQIQDPEMQQLPKEVEMNIQSFTNSLRNIEVGKEFATQSARYVENKYIKPKYDEQGKRQKETYSDEEVSALTSAENSAIQNGLDLLEQWTILKTRQVNSELVGQAYNQQLKRLQASFKANLSDIDQQSSVLSEVLKRINTSNNKEQLKEGLLQLSDLKDKNLTKDDLEQFLNGTKDIQI